MWVGKVKWRWDFFTLGSWNLKVCIEGEKGGWEGKKEKIIILVPVLREFRTYDILHSRYHSRYHWLLPTYCISYLARPCVGLSIGPGQIQSDYILTFFQSRTQTRQEEWVDGWKNERTVDRKKERKKERREHQILSFLPSFFLFPSFPPSLIPHVFLFFFPPFLPQLFRNSYDIFSTVRNDIITIIIWKPILCCKKRRDELSPASAQVIIIMYYLLTYL